MNYYGETIEMCDGMVLGCTEDSELALLCKSIQGVPYLLIHNREGELLQTISPRATVSVGIGQDNMGVVYIETPAPFIGTLNRVEMVVLDGKILTSKIEQHTHGEDPWKTLAVLKITPVKGENTCTSITIKQLMERIMKEESNAQPGVEECLKTIDVTEVNRLILKTIMDANVRACGPMCDLHLMDLPSDIKSLHELKLWFEKLSTNDKHIKAIQSVRDYTINLLSIDQPFKPDNDVKPTNYVLFHTQLREILETIRKLTQIFADTI